MPTVSIIVPCYNEQATIHLLLDAIYAQSYPRQQMEVVIADGMSTDQTREYISAYQKKHPDLSIQLVDNPKRIIPAALNHAISRAKGEYLIRMDAHSVPHKHYVSRSIAALGKKLGDNIGGVWQIAPGGEGWIARTIAAAAAHPLGVGDAYYRHSKQAQEVDTVPFGAFHRGLIEKIGGFDESLQANEDYEFNVRVREAGGTVWLDPEIQATYFARPTLRALARQYLRYGFWKGQMLRRYPQTLRWRQALPPLFVLSLLFFAVLALWFPWAAGLLAFEISVYSLAMIFAGLQAAVQKRDINLILGLPLAIATMHVCWGSALLWSLLRFAYPRNAPSI